MQWCRGMRRTHHLLPFLMIAMAAPLVGRAGTADRADRLLEQFLDQSNAQPAYKATRRLEAENGSRAGWMEAITEFSPASGFSYKITGEGGSSYIRSNVLREVLEGERKLMANGDWNRSLLAPANYTFQSNGIDAEGLVNVLVAPRRKETTLVNGGLFLHPESGDLIRLQGRLAKSPSFWIKHVDVVRSYERINGTVVPVALDSRAQLKMLGKASLRIKYNYQEIDGRPVGMQ